MHVADPLRLAAPLLLATCLHGVQFTVDGPDSLTVFLSGAWRISVPEAVRRLPGTVVHDAYDADRDRNWLRIDGRFWSDTGAEMKMPGFALREAAEDPWSFALRWSPPAAGIWHLDLRLQVESTGPEALAVDTLLADCWRGQVQAPPGVAGFLRAPGQGEHPRYLRQTLSHGDSRALWLFGAWRAWVAGEAGKGDGWHRHEWIDRQRELLPNLRAGGFNLLGQWMAPWEFFLLHHDRAEHWQTADGSWQRHPLDDDEAWHPSMNLDQGRAAGFDRLLALCAGDAERDPIYLLLTPLPHQCLQMRAHPWGANESGWSPEDDGGGRSLAQLNGFSALRPGMSAWDFFAADPRHPVGDWRSQLFDHQANFWRYLVARWGHSRAVGLWVLIDELDAVGDVLGSLRDGTGWWGNPDCARWLDDIRQLLAEELLRSDGLRYAGDPYRRPLHAATTSHVGEFHPEGNIAWQGGGTARIDFPGWHWYPNWPQGLSAGGRFAYTIDGIWAYSRLGPHGPLLISEFGAPDRWRPDSHPALDHPSLYHVGIWASVFGGQAGSVIDWDDGKEYGELRWRERPGAFDHEQYPIDHVARMQALQRFLGGAQPDSLSSSVQHEQPIQCISRGNDRVATLADGGHDLVMGWLFAPDGVGSSLLIEGLEPGDWQLQWHDPWTGDPVPDAVPAPHLVGADGRLELHPQPVLERLHALAADQVPRMRVGRGLDVAFRLTR